MGARRDKIETLLWGVPPKDGKERKLLVKLDAVILSYVSHKSMPIRPLTPADLS